MNPRVIFLPLLLGALWVAPVLAQAPTDVELLNKRPFDLVVLKASAGGAEQRVLPIDFPDRRVPSPFPAGWLKVRLVERPGVELEVAWGDIARIALHERQLLKRAGELTDAGDFDEAFGFFVRLHNEYPGTPGLAESTERYLVADANRAYRAGDYDMTIALLLSINDRYPSSPTLGRAVDAVAGKLIEQRVADRDFRGAREQLTIIEQRFERLELATVARWRDRFRKAADAKADEGRRLLESGDYRAAHRAAEQAITVWPSHEASRLLQQEIDARYPRISVGVTTASLAAENGPLSVRLDAPAARRTAPLAAPTVTRLVGYTGEGGRYATPLGLIQLDDTARYLELSARGDFTPFALARWLARATTSGSPAYRPGLAGVMSSIRVDAPDRVVLSLARAHFRPEALLKDVLLSEAGVEDARRVTVLRRDQELFVAELQRGEQDLITVEETVFRSDDAAVLALGRGSVDLIADVPPWRLNALRDDREISVVRQLLPTVHGLIPTKRQPLLDEREFRRGLLYGIDRERILNEVLLGREQEQGFRVVSGPFPFGVSLADPVRYGYNDAVAPRPYDPRLSAILTAIAWNKVLEEREAGGEAGDEQPTDEPLPVLTIAHGTDPIARTACQAIQLQLQGLGYDIELIELSEPELLAGEPDFDFRYAELTIGEPAVDAHTLLGPGGLTGRCTDTMRAALRKLNAAQNTKEVQFALFDIHRLANSDLPLLPLWQTTKHIAYRKRIEGIAENPASLYGGVASWRKQPVGASN